MASECLTTDAVARYVASNASTPADAITAHVERCDACRATIAAAVRANRAAPPTHDDGLLTIGTRVGRYVIAEGIGMGGMGRVYAAYDPELDRRVAVKLLHPTAVDADAVARLQREAQLAAKLAHPNVVAVYDVGAVGDQTFIAMELVAGKTLRAWLEAPHTWREIVAMFRQAGEGIAAAHAAGLVHRDIKPENILVGDDGRVRVTDFGLARTAVDSVPSKAGTPAYMAPEQLGGLPADARSDQYSFCVALYEGLYGGRPGVESHKRIAVPAYVRRVAVRGLADDPQLRFPTFAALLAALAVDPRVKRRRVAFTAIAIVAVGGGLALARRDVASPCDGDPGGVARAWGPPQRAALVARFVASGRPFASVAATSVDEAFDRYAAGLVSMRRDACEATHVRNDQSPELLDRRIACLDERRAALAGQAQMFATADATLVDRSVRLATELPALDPCANTKALLALVPLPVELTKRIRIQPLREQLVAAELLDRNAKYDDARRAAAALHLEVDALGYAPLIANVDELDGQIAQDVRDFATAGVAFERAANAAEVGGDDATKARASVAGALALGMSGGDPTKLFERARATLARIGGDPAIELRLELALGAIALQRGAFDEAVTHDQKAHDLSERLYGANDLRTLIITGDLAQAYERVGKYEDASKTAQAELTALEKLLGASHPRVAMVRGTWGQILYDQAKYDAALAQSQRSLADLERVYGVGHVATWSALSDIARVYEAQTKFDLALAAFERARDIVDRSLGPTHPNAILIRQNVATAKLELGHFDDAVAGFREVVALSTKVIGPDNIFAANAQNGIAQAWHSTHPDEALVAARESLRLFEKLEGPEHPDVGRGYDSLGKVLDKLGKRAEAIAALEKAVAIRIKALGPDHPDVADSSYTLAIWLYPTAHARAHTLADAARRTFEAAGDKTSADTIATWLQAHP